jgi:hypothetical protein
MPWTPYADLDELIDELLGHWRRILGDNLAGAYVQGSFALGAGDLQSDCDWIVATQGPLQDDQVAALREVHDEIPTRDGHWPHDIEGSYAPIGELASVAHLGREWLFNDHGHRTLVWDDHCNRAYRRWILREHGITCGGLASTSLPAARRRGLRRQIPHVAPPAVTCGRVGVSKPPSTGDLGRYGGAGRGSGDGGGPGGPVVRDERRAGIRQRSPSPCSRR